jgi:cysteine-rich repeat protein
VFIDRSVTGSCRAEPASYGDSICRGRCGIGCSWWDEDYTWDCLDHDVCLSYSSDCGFEFENAADDWAVTVGPYCTSGRDRPQPTAFPRCGDGRVDPGEQCDDGNAVSGDGCSPSCTRVDHLVINEVDYENGVPFDQPGGDDTTEFIEVFNGTGSDVALTDLAVVLASSNTVAEYMRIPLSGTLPAGGYLVVCTRGVDPGTCAAGVPVAPGARIFNLAYVLQNLLSGDPYGVALVDLVRRQVVDALAYEGAMPVVTIDGVGPVDFGAPASVVDDSGAAALALLPDGADTDAATADFALRPITPGAPNQ